MNTIYDIVDFYETIKQQDLFPDSIFLVESIMPIEQKIEATNKKFFNLLRSQAQENNISYQALQMAYNDLNSIYWELDGELKNFHLYNIEQTPLFRFKIKYESALLSIAFSRIAVINGISEIYWYLEKHFLDKLNLKEPLNESNYTPPYVDEIGYTKHIYTKFFQNDFLKKELYGYKEYWIKKIDEFLEYIPSEINISLPIDHMASRFNETEGDDLDDMSNRNELQEFLDSFGVISDDKGSLVDTIEKLIKESQHIMNENKVAVKIKVTPLFSISDSFKKDITGNDYIKDLFNSLRDSFKLLDTKTKLSEFKSLFENQSVEKMVIVNNSKKLLSIVKFLKKNHILKLHHQYIKLMVNCFEEPNGKLIETKSLYGSKYILTLDEETKLKNLFHQLSS